MNPAIAVVGAGLAGIACARRLAEAGIACRVFEAQRAPGGRLATRRFSAASFDHGAQYLTARDAGFRAMLEAARAAGAAKTWQPRWPGAADAPLWVGSPGMSTLPRALARGLDLELGATIVALDRGRRGWSLLDDRGAAHVDFDTVVLALPAPVAAALAAGHTDAAVQLRAVELAPCWAVMAAFERPVAFADDAAFVEDPALAWVARDGSKPGREAPHAWVLHATAAWSRDRLDDEPSAVARALLERFAARVGAALPPTFVSDAHCWRHARVATPLGQPCLFDATAGIGFCGDWCLEPRAEAAWLSGRALGGLLAGARAPAASGKIRGSR